MNVTGLSLSTYPPAPAPLFPPAQWVSKYTAVVTVCWAAASDVWKVQLGSRQQLFILYWPARASPLAAQLSQQAAGNCFIVSTAALHSATASSLPGLVWTMQHLPAFPHQQQPTTQLIAEQSCKAIIITTAGLSLLLCSQKSDTSTFFLVVLGIWHSVWNSRNVKIPIRKYWMFQKHGDCSSSWLSRFIRYQDHSVNCED